MTKQIFWTLLTLLVLAAISVGWWTVDGLMHRREGVIPPDKLRLDPNYRDPPLPDKLPDPDKPAYRHQRPGALKP